jgi:transposase
MPKALSIDLRERIVETYKTTLLSQDEVAARFKVGVATVVRLIAMSKKGSLEPKPHSRGPERKIQGEILQTLKSIIEGQPDLTNPELLEKLEAASGIRTSTSAISRAIQELGFTRKKNAIGVRKVQRKGPESVSGVS